MKTKSVYMVKGVGDKNQGIGCRVWTVVNFLLHPIYCLLHVFIIVCTLYPIPCLYSETSRISSIIDTPTAEVVEYSNYDLSFRLHGTGGVLSKMTFGVFKPINIGISWDVDKLIGLGSTEIDTRPPTIFFKAKIFSGGFKLPVISVGYDGQGYGEYSGDWVDGIWVKNDTTKYEHREKGIFLVLTREYLIPGFEISIGGNIYDFDRDHIYGFSGVTYGIENRFLLLAECDNISKLPSNRVNLGAKVLITDNVDVELAGRDLFKGNQSERIAIISSKGKF